MDVLDNANVIAQRDPQNALGVAAGQCDYFAQAFEAEFVPGKPVLNIVWAGMGGSALPMVVVQSWPQLRIPFEVVRNYDIPPYVGEQTLFVASSYSGNTEETLEALRQAEQKGAQIVVVAAGGKLAEIARDKQYPLFSIPAGIQPRMATFYFVNAFVSIVKNLDVAHYDTNELASVGEWLRGEITAWMADIPTESNYAKQIALKLMGKTVIMYAGPKLYPAANKWKICMNENAKNTAWVNAYPELNHNEFIGWSSHPVEKPFAVVEIRSGLEHDRVQKRFEVTERLLSGMRPSPLVVSPRGETLLQQLAWSFALGDFVSIYLALLNGVNPTPVELVEKLKVELG
ncbi:MAG: bifunctional phosphoglucose/phosphomannose isomerase [Candidatus Saccharimonadales bacterium]